VTSQERLIGSLGFFFKEIAFALQIPDGFNLPINGVVHTHIFFGIDFDHFGLFFVVRSLPRLLEMDAINWFGHLDIGVIEGDFHQSNGLTPALGTKLSRRILSATNGFVR
jgi:hypothetical protein